MRLFSNKLRLKIFSLLFVCAELINELARATELKFGMRVEGGVSRKSSKIKTKFPQISEKGDEMSCCNNLMDANLQIITLTNTIHCIFLL